MKAKGLKAKLTAKKVESRPDFSQGLSSGSTLVNLACTGRPDVAWLPGHYYLLVGDSQSGKTWLSLSTLAEACYNTKYKGYRLIHDNPERGSLMDLERYFGELATRLEPPSERGASTTSEEFYDNVDDAVRAGKPFIYILDSEDALSSDAERKKARQDKNARRKAGEDAPDLKGSYGDGKAKKNSSGIRIAHNGLEATGSILIVIKQSRDNIGPDAMFDPKTRSGGRALTFYATNELWFSVKGKLRVKYKGRPVVNGSRLKVQVKKNRGTGLPRPVELLHYPSIGIDDLGSMIDFLVQWGKWKERGKDEYSKVVEAPEFDFDGKARDLIEQIEKDNREGELRELVLDLWQDIEEAVEVRRKPRYS